MDPAESIAAAIAAGAAATATGVEQHGFSTAYHAVRTLISERYAGVDLTAVEADPRSWTSRAALIESLRSTAAAADVELTDAADHLSGVLARHFPDIAGAIGVSLHKVRAGAVRITDVAAVGPGVVAVDTSVDGSLEIGGVRSGRESPPPPMARP
ncbi:hypothetical protein [Nocardia bovistercoris]|uniref:Uncharacterized protein n=1 Tax=Nocardia bovistercoris TaxID=2785916 RepID=A0A931I6U7_9NOCA|nr:hypothetical protein [Nocardia bovistercoris]MBH0775301.1 hypothetical protein [Nocardia bovistercoris]